MTQKLGILGWPARHSLSPKIHRFWFREHAIEATYEIMETPEDALAIELVGIRSGAFRGVNVTVPHKEKALTLVDEADDVARRIGAVNTILVKEEGKLFGSNTDAFGFSESLKQSGCDLADVAARPVILGAGGAARAVVAALADAGAKDILVLNRTRARSEALAAEWPIVRAGNWEDRDKALEGATLLINTTSLGMERKDPLEISLGALPKDAWVTDVVYVPLETALLKAAKKRGNRTVDGLGMLLHQAQASFRLWFGITPKVTDELRAHILAA